MYMCWCESDLPQDCTPHQGICGNDQGNGVDVGLYFLLLKHTAQCIGHAVEYDDYDDHDR